MKRDFKIKFLTIFMALFVGVSINASFIAASRHLYHLGDSHDHPNSCLLREFMDIIAVSFVLAAAAIASIAVKRVKLKKSYRSFIGSILSKPVSRGPPLVPFA